MSIRVLITETINEVSIEETEVIVRVEEQTVVVNIGEASGGSDIDLSDANPQSLGTAAAGVLDTASRSDHVHGHGNLAGGNFHANATDAAAGFMSASSKAKLDGIEEGATNTSLTTDPAEDLGGSSAGVSAEAARADHVHAHGDQAGGSLHAAVVASGAAGFMTGADKATLDVLAARALPYYTLQLQTGNTAPVRAANDAEIAAAIVLCGVGAVMELIAPPGEFYFGTTVVVDKPITLRGAGEWFYNGTTFWFPQNTSAMRIAFTGGDDPGAGRGTSIERMRFGPATAGVFDADTPGILIQARCFLRNVNVTSMPGHGIAVVASTGDDPATNANLVRMDNVRCDANLGHGFYFDGADANACLLTACDAASNLLDGFHDSSFLGVYLHGCHSEANGGASYVLGVDVNADSQAVSCYVEGGQDPVLLLNKALWLGPFPAGGFDEDSTGIYLTNARANSISFENELGGNTVQFRAGRIANQVGFELSSESDGYNPWQMIYGNVNGAAVVGAWSLLYRGTDSVLAFVDDTNATPANRRQMWLPAGAHFGADLGDQITGTERVTAPQAAGAASAGSGTLVALSNHVHPADPVALKLVGNMTLAVSDAGTDVLASHTLRRDSGTEATAFATLAGALGYSPLNLNGFTLTINDSRASGSESLSIGGFVNGAVVLNDVRFGTVTVRDMSDIEINDGVLVGVMTVDHCSGAITATASGSGRLLLRACANIEATLVATSCTSTALRGEHCQYIGYAIDANSCTATPVEFFNCVYTEIIGAGVTGTNAGAPFAVSLSAGGKHALTGASMTGADDLDVDGYTTDWAGLSTRNIMRAGTFAFWGDNQWRFVGQMRITNDSSTPFDDLQVDSIQIETYKKEYSADRALDPAHQEITAHAGGGQGSATLCGRQTTIVTAVATAGDSIRLFTDADVPAMGGGAKGTIINGGANALDLFPPSGQKLYLNGADQGTNTAISLATGSRIEWLCDNNDDFWINT